MTNFSLPDCDLHVQTITGETEGLYGWLAANYLLGGLDRPNEHNHGKGHHTYGFLDMGGASAQIAFAPNATVAKEHANDLKLIRLRNINGSVEEYRVFVTTWLGFGANEARRQYVENLMKHAKPVDGEFPDPCLPAGLTISTKGDVLTPDKINGKEAHLVGTGKFKECLSSTSILLDKNAPCPDQPCLMHGVHVPNIDFDVNHFVGISEYWHTTHEIFEFGHKDKAYDVKTYQQRVTEFCSENWAELSKKVKEEKFGHKVKESTAVEVCFKASWLINVLHEGIGIPRVGLETSAHNKSSFTEPFQAVNKIEGTEVSWTLGKMLLYAASEVPHGKTNSLPVGIGSNKPGIPSDFQFAGITQGLKPNITQPHQSDDGDHWHDTLFEGNTPRRIPGFLLFLFILCVAMFLLCGKDRRSRFYRKFSRFTGRRSGFRRRGIFSNKNTGLSLHGANERLLESGMYDPGDFELGSVDGDSDDHSDSSSRSKTGKTSGRMTPKIQTPKLETAMMSEFIGPTTNLPSVNAMDRSGLFVRTDSREKLNGLGLGDAERRSRSRKGSPTRYKKSPLIGAL